MSGKQHHLVNWVTAPTALLRRAKPTLLPTTCARFVPCVSAPALLRSSQPAWPLAGAMLQAHRMGWQLVWRQLHTTGSAGMHLSHWTLQVPEGMQSLFLCQPQSELNKTYRKCQVRWILFPEILESSQLSSFKTVTFKLQCCNADIITSQQCPLSRNKTSVWFDEANTFSRRTTLRLLKLWGFAFYFTV